MAWLFRLRYLLAKGYRKRVQILPVWQIFVQPASVAPKFVVAIGFFQSNVLVSCVRDNPKGFASWNG